MSVKTQKSLPKLKYRTNSHIEKSEIHSKSEYIRTSWAYFINEPLTVKNNKASVKAVKFSFNSRQSKKNGINEIIEKNTEKNLSQNRLSSPINIHILNNT